MFWPGKENATKHLRDWIVWCQFEQECPWEIYKELEPERDPISTEAEAITELCISGLQPALGDDTTGLADYLRAELRHHGTSLDELFANLRPPLESIPWDALSLAEHRRDALESRQIELRIRKERPINY